MAFDAMDQDEDGFINFGEFVRACGKILHLQVRRSLLALLMRCCVAVLTVPPWLVPRSYSHKLSQPFELRRVYDRLADDDGLLSPTEFVHGVRHHKLWGSIVGRFVQARREGAGREGGR